MTSSHFLIRSGDIRFPFAILEGDDHTHLQRVLRAKPGKKVWLVDEQGTTYFAEVEEVTADRTRLRVLEKRDFEAPRVLFGLAQAILKGKKMDFLVQKGTELGMSFLIPVATKRTVIKLAGKETARVARWQRIARQAVKQSRSRLIPEIRPFASWEEFLKVRPEEIKYILSENRGTSLRDIVAAPPVNVFAARETTVLLLVGPEGGWEPEEEETAIARGFEPVSLGSRVLRAETAAIVGLAMMTQFWGQ